MIDRILIHISENNAVTVTILTENDGFVGQATAKTVKEAYRRAFSAARCYLTLMLFDNVE